MSKRLLACAAAILLTTACATTRIEAKPSIAHGRGRAHAILHAPRPKAQSGARPSVFAAFVLDANSGRTLFARNENAQRQPASITKVMTLYLLFERLERGCFALDSPLTVSAHAASQAPSKIGLSPRETIDVESAIKAVVTKSANDIATAIGEAIGGDEPSFARMMNGKARALGMLHTHFANASGLPDGKQMTTARDLAILGAAIQQGFPDYFDYFSTQRFAYRGHVYLNHNHLLRRLPGMDGVKTGFVRASGYNLLASVRRNGRDLIAVVLGGRSAASRDRAMAALIERSMATASPIRTARPLGPGVDVKPSIDSRTCETMRAGE